MQMMLEGDRVVIASGVNHWNLESNHPLLELMATRRKLFIPTARMACMTNSYLH